MGRPNEADSSDAGRATGELDPLAPETDAADAIERSDVAEEQDLAGGGVRTTGRLDRHAPASGRSLRRFGRAATDVAGPDSSAPSAPTITSDSPVPASAGSLPLRH